MLRDAHFFEDAFLKQRLLFRLKGLEFLLLFGLQNLKILLLLYQQLKRADFNFLLLCWGPKMWRWSLRRKWGSLRRNHIHILLHSPREAALNAVRLKKRNAVRLSKRQGLHGLACLRPRLNSDTSLDSKFSLY